jgi:23S rRNA (guanosine2251-2'-O)-methyltransferase
MAMKSDYIPGFHAVKAALQDDQIQILELWIAKGKKSGRALEIMDLAREKGVRIHFKDRNHLGQLLPDVAHQGIVAVVGSFQYVDLKDFVDTVKEPSGSGLLMAADHITDEGNLGAMLRTAAFFGVQGLILPKDRSAGLSGRVVKRAAGAHLHLPVCRVVNLGRALDQLNQVGFWIIGAAGEATENVYGFDWARDVVLVLGREDRGLSPGVRKRCHQLVSIPGGGAVESLNVAVACGIILSEIARQRGNQEDTSPLFPQKESEI